ncbi:conserved protein, unknown function [Hepatocystis sp. ex Piliocolobus tephrosceles]|nr:conserved protein, unknown function [Hepatocystis sp. ex Piliocolobus tephrosceles]
MVLKKRYEYSPLEEIFFPKHIGNSQYYEDDDVGINTNKKNTTKQQNGNLKTDDINNIKNNLLKTDMSLDLCQNKKDYYLNTKETNNNTSYFFFNDYRKCIFNVDGKIYMDNTPFKILSDNTKKDERLNENFVAEDFNTFVHVYNL